MPKAVLAQTTYQKLLHTIISEVQTGIKKIERLAEKQKIQTYWNIGKHINGYCTSQAIGHGSIGRFYEDISNDLKMSSRTLQHCEQFFRYFPLLKIEKDLSWSHYMYLLRVDEAKERKRWIARLRKNPISSRELRLKLIDVTPAAEKTLPRKIPIVRGELYTYRLVPAKRFQRKTGAYLVDCGFANRIEAPCHSAKLSNKRLYRSQKEEAGYTLKVCDLKVDELFTFKAHILRVIDADTFLTLVDQGFGIWSEQRLRLRGVDAPELNTLFGQKAKRTVETVLCKLPFVIVKTYKSDKYDRYLVDVFYLSGEQDPHIVAAKGKLLNQEMIDRGLAKMWMA